MSQYGQWVGTALAAVTCTLTVSMPSRSAHRYRLFISIRRAIELQHPIMICGIFKRLVFFLRASGYAKPMDLTYA